MTKTILSLSTVLCLTTPIYADYAYCKAFESSKQRFYFSAVFYTSNSGATLDTTEGSEFADKYLTYGGDGANCYSRSSKSEIKKRRSGDIQDEKRWAKITTTGWRP